MSFEFTVRYYADVWDDEEAQRLAKHTVADGEVVSLTRLVERFARPSYTWATVYIDDTWIVSYTRDIESGEWREAR